MIGAIVAAAGPGSDRDRRGGEAASVARRRLVQETWQIRREPRGAERADDDPAQEHHGRLADHEAPDIAARRAERDPDPQLALHGNLRIARPDRCLDRGRTRASGFPPVLKG